jgi:uncharacterized protein (DUF1697 family)
MTNSATRAFTLPSYASLQDTKGREMAETEWITVREAQPLLKVTTTQGVWNVIERAQRQHGVTVKRRNIGTDEMARYLLDKSDVENVARVMGKL